MPTSARALRRFLAWMTCPRRRSRSYFGSAAETEVATARPRRARSRGVILMTSAPPRGAPPRRPLRAQVLAHVEGATHLVARHLAREGVADGVATLLAHEAAEAHAVAVDRSREVAGNEIAAVGAVDLVAALAQVQLVVRDPRRVLDLHVPLAAQVRGRGRGRWRLVLVRRTGQEGEEAVGHDLLVARRHHVRIHADPGEGGIRLVAGREHTDARITVEEGARRGVTAEAEPLAVPEHVQG